MLILPSMPTQAKQDALAPAWETRYFHSCCRSPASMFFFYFHAVRPSTANKGSSLVPSLRSVVGLDNVRTCSTNVKRTRAHTQTQFCSCCPVRHQFTAQGSIFQMSHLSPQKLCDLSQLCSTFSTVHIRNSQVAYWSNKYYQLNHFNFGI